MNINNNWGCKSLKCTSVYTITGIINQIVTTARDVCEVYRTEIIQQRI